MRTRNTVKELPDVGSTSKLLKLSSSETAAAAEPEPSKISWGGAAGAPQSNAMKALIEEQKKDEGPEKTESKDAVPEQTESKDAVPEKTESKDAASEKRVSKDAPKEPKVPLGY